MKMNKANILMHTLKSKRIFCQVEVHISSPPPLSIIVAPGGGEGQNGVKKSNILQRYCRSREKISNVSWKRGSGRTDFQKIRIINTEK